MNSSEKLPISVTMIARNEAGNLRRSLASVRDWVEEVVVVINDCSDDTAEVARSFGAKVYEHPWSNFRDQKNISLEYTRQPWVLGLDADEEISPELRQSIRFFLAETGAGKKAAIFARRTWFLGRWIRHGDWYPDHCLRLFRKGEGLWAGTDEHCLVQIPEAVVLSGDLLHYGFPDINTMVHKITVFSDAFLNQQVAKGRRFSLGGVVFRSFWRFFRAYILRRGFLDGYPGFFIAVSTAYYTFVRYSRLYEHAHRRVEP